MNKFNIGDKVQIVSARRFCEFYYSDEEDYGLVSEMWEYCDEKLVVADVKQSDSHFYYKMQGDDYWWNEALLSEDDDSFQFTIGEVVQVVGVDSSELLCLTDEKRVIKYRCYIDGKPFYRVEGFLDWIQEEAFCKLKKEDFPILKAKQKPVEVECLQWTGHNLADIKGFCGSGSIISYTFKDSAGEKTTILKIITLEGLMRADVGDYIIKGVKGEFFPCKSDIFHLAYELVTD